MEELSAIILENYQRRKTKKQKQAFIDLLQRHLPELQVEQGGFGKNRNLVLGDVASAKVLLTAHYDTCAQLPFPNFATPKNLPVYFGYSLLLTLPFLLLLGGLGWLMEQLTDSFWLQYWGTFLPPILLLYFVFMGGKPNPNTANDNTSGVLLLLQLYEAMSEAQRRQVAFVFFDNEENGLLGSSFFARLHKKENLKEKLVLNFDCVGDGNHMLFVHSKQAFKQFGEVMEQAFRPTKEKMVYLETTSSAFYPSDQANFPVSIGVAAMNRKKRIGLYLDKIHTKKDTVLDETNLQYLRENTLKLMALVLAE